MRIRLWGLLTALLVLASSASAQWNYGSTNPSIVRQTATNVRTTSLLPTMPRNAGGPLLNFFPKFNGVNNHKGVDRLALPTPDKMPGLDYLKAFDLHYGYSAK